MATPLSLLCQDLLTIIDNLRPDLELVHAHESNPKGWKAAAKRVRDRTKILGKLGLEFRKLSVKAAKE